ncbi:hypothetical protein M0R04_09225 [Candidatus Dojkabacteria bacterium]|jgi:hypothetical protein|nr:hypothetical protein [Candidatus Dojkabacteria bacterium]
MSAPEKIYDEIVTRWNKQADEFNQWDNLSIDEKVEFAYQCGTELAECKAEGEIKRLNRELDRFADLKAGVNNE